MRTKVKDRLIGAVVTSTTTCFAYLVFSFFNSFETKADSASKFAKLDHKLDIALCLLSEDLCKESIRDYLKKSPNK